MRKLSMTRRVLIGIFVVLAIAGNVALIFSAIND